MRRLLPTVLFAIVLGPVSHSVQAQLISREAELKGAMVGLLPQLITWPQNKAPTRSKPLKIGIVGDDPFVDASGENYLQNKLGNTAEIDHFASADDIEDCHILVISETADFKQSLAKAKGNSVLIVSESPGKATEGAAINLVFNPATNRIRMEINPPNAIREGIRISRGLLRSKLVDVVGNPG